MMKVVIVDDEPKAIQSLTWELEHFKNDVDIVKSFTDPEEAIEYLIRNVLAVDCFFHDIHMPKMDGLNMLNKLQPRDEYAVIITTAYDDYSIKAIKQEVLDYLLKPFDSDDLQDTIKN